jgi:hypothetical protein
MTATFARSSQTARTLWPVTAQDKSLSRITVETIVDPLQIDSTGLSQQRQTG